MSDQFVELSVLVVELLRLLAPAAVGVAAMGH
jgi:hypothetical protein